jgi:hypothetical protein
MSDMDESSANVPRDQASGPQPGAPSRRDEPPPGKGMLPTGKDIEAYVSIPLSAVRGASTSERSELGIAAAELDIAAGETKLLRSAQEELAKSRRYMKYGVWAALGAASAAIVTAVATLVTQSGALVSGALLSILATSLTLLVAAVLAFYFGSRRSASSSLRQGRSYDRASILVELLTTLVRIESAGAIATASEGQSPTVSQLIPELVERGLWSEEDARKFRETLQVRNRFVHGNAAIATNDAELKVAAETAHQLLDKIVVAKGRVGSK